jgi:hypothetical protein
MNDFTISGGEYVPKGFKLPEMQILRYAQDEALCG